MTCCPRLPGVLLAALFLLGTAGPARAQTFTWTRDADESWNTAANWDQNAIPNGPGVSVVFGSAITANRTVTLDSSVTVGAISFENTTFSYTIGGTGTLTLDNGATPASISIAANVTAGQTITRQLIAQSDVAITNNSLSGLLTLSGGMSLGSRTLSVTGVGTVNFSNNPITGSAGSRLVLDGSGAVYVSSNNTGLKYEVNGGTLVANAALALQEVTPGVVTPDLITLTNGGTVNFHVEQSRRDFIGVTLGAGGGRIASDAASPVIVSGPITGSGSITKIGPQTIALSGLNNYTGETIIRQGTLRIDAHAPNGLNGALGNATSAVILGDNVGGNSTALLIGVNGVSVGRDITVVASPAPGTSTVTIGVQPQDVFSAASGSFTGTLTLNRDVILTGLAAGAGSGVTFGRITGNGGVTIAGVAPITFTSAANDFAGTITLDGTLSIDTDAKLGAPSNALIFDSGALRITGSTPFSTSRPITLDSLGRIDVQNTDSVSGFTILSEITGPGTIRKLGPGILTLSGANTYQATTEVEAGTLQAAAANVLSPNSTLMIHPGATVKLNGFSQQIAKLFSGTPTSTTDTLDLGSNPATVLTVGRNGMSIGNAFFHGQIIGLGNLVFTGTSSQWMGGTGSYLGTTTVRQGIVELRAAVPASGNGPLGNAAGGAIRLGDANFAGFDAALLSTDESSNGFARSVAVAAGLGTRTIGHRRFGTSSDGKIITFSGPITLEKDLHLYTMTTLDYVGPDLRVSGVVSGAGGLIKIGGGEARLTADNSYTGFTTISNGRLVIGGSGLPDGAARTSSGFIVGTDWSNPGPGLDNQVSPAPTDRNFAELVIQDYLPNTNRIGDVDVTLAQGRFGYFGQSAGASAESFRNLFIEQSANTLEVIIPTSTNTASATLNLTGGLTRANNGTLHIVATGLGDSDGGDFARVLASSPPALSGGGGAAGSTNVSIIPWAYHSTGPNGVLPIRNFLTYGVTGLRPLAASEYVDTLTSPGSLNNVRLTAAATPLNQNQTINSLFYDRAAADTVTLTGQTLTINSGAILTRSDLLTFDGGEIAFGSAEGIFHSPDFSSITINSVLSGSGGLTSHLGSGATLTLNGVNTYTGPTAINSGHVAFNNAASFGAGLDPIRLRWGWSLGQGGTMTYTGAGATTLAKPIEIGPSTNTLRLSNGGTLTLTGVISGAGIDPLNHALTFSSTTGAGVIELRAVNTFTGNVRLLSGTLSIAADSNLGPASNRLTLGNSANPAPTLRIDATGIEIARPITIGGNVAIRTNFGFDASISGPMSGGEYIYTMTKTGTGTLTLTGTHSYAATTQIIAGSLRVNGTLTDSFTTGYVHVHNGASLSGSGTVMRPVRMNNGGILEPGAGVGTLTLGELEFATTATAGYLWEAGAAAQDHVVVTNGPVNLTGIQLNVGLYDRGLGTSVSPDRQFPLLTVAGTNSITGFDPAKVAVFFTDTPNWSTSQYSVNVVQLNGDSVLMLSNISPVPEPAGVVALASAVLGLAAWRRRREPT